MNKKLLLSLTPGALFLGTLASCSAEEPVEQPNIIYILADDLGYGDLSCYGQQLFRTPNLDKLAERGIRFTQHYAGTTVSAPSRSALMTGLHTGHTPIRGNKRTEPEGQQPLPEGTYTMGHMFRQAGYATGAYGKWSLGGPGSVSTPAQCGFDDFYGYLCQTLAHNYYPEFLRHNDEMVLLPANKNKGYSDYAQDLIHQEALHFIQNNKDRPFFLYLPYIVPHAEMLVPDDSIFARFKGQFPETPYIGVEDGPTFRKGPYESSEYPKASFASMIVRLDVYVGQILQLLDELEISDNTLIIFTSDNGPHREGGADPDFFNSNAGLRGYKRDLYEGGIRVPMIACWPGKIPANTTSEHISAFWDMLPTFAEIARVELPVPVDGISMLPALLGTEKQAEHPFLYWEFHENGGSMAIRQGNWKAIRLNVQRPARSNMELYDLSVDVQEQNNLSESQPDLVKQFEDLMMQAHQPSDIFPLFPEE